METLQTWGGRFKQFFLDNKFVLFLLVLLLIGLNILVFMKTSFIFTPIIVLLKTIALPVILTGIVYYLLNPIVDILEKNKSEKSLFHPAPLPHYYRADFDYGRFNYSVFKGTDHEPDRQSAEICGYC